MAKHVLVDASVTVNAVNLSDHVESVQFTTGINPQVAAAMSEVQDYNMPGTQSVGDITVTFYQDYAATETYATLQSIWAARSVVTLIVKPTSAADSATNPAFTVPVFVASHPLITGSRGERHMAQAVFSPAGPIVFDIT